jgi:hypothetical protein
MKKELFLVQCLTILMIITASSATNAESGWVLWKKAELMEMALKKTTIWEIVNAYPDHAQCLQAKEKKWRVLKAEAVEDKKKYSTIVGISDAPYETVIKNYKEGRDILSSSDTLYCLPGTLDPRERK